MEDICEVNVGKACTCGPILLFPSQRYKRSDPPDDHNVSLCAHLRRPTPTDQRTANPTTRLPMTARESLTVARKSDRFEEHTGRLPKPSNRAPRQ